MSDTTMANVNAERFINGLHEWARDKVYAPLAKRIKAVEEENRELRDRLARIEGKLEAGREEFRAAIEADRREP